MKVDIYERIWMWGVTVMLAVFFATTAIAALGHQLQPPSHVETIDPKAAMSDPRFRTQGVSVDPEGKVHATIVALMFAWLPPEFAVPAETPVTFHLTSIDVIHGFQIVRSNGQSMVIPGYISQFTTQFNLPGEYLIACNEYCGIGHHGMMSKMRVVPKAQWKEPGTPVAAAPESEEIHHDR